MAEEEVIPQEEVASPASEAASTEVVPEAPVVEAENGEVPAASEEDSQDIGTLQAAVEAATTPEEKKAAQSKVNVAWAKLRKAKTDAEKQAEFYRGQSVVLKKDPAATEVKEEKPAYVIPDFLKPAPKLEDFDFDDAKYQAAKDDWLIEKAEHKAYHKVKAETEANDQRRQQESMAEQVSRWKQKGQELHPDFLEVAKPDEIQLTGAMRDAIWNDERSHDIAYYLGKNPKEHQRILNIRNPYQQAAEIGKISEKFKAAPPKKTTTSAPQPFTPVKGVAVAPKELKDMTVEERIAFWDEQEFGGGS